MHAAKKGYPQGQVLRNRQTQGMLTKADIIRALGGLSATDRAEIVQWCDALGVQNLTRQDNEYADHAYQELSQLLSLHYRTPQPSLTTFARTRTAQYRKLLTAVARVKASVEAWWPAERKPVKLALVRFLCRVAMSSCSRKRKVGWPQLVTALQDIESSVNAEFPGWIRAGLFQKRALAMVTGGLRHVREEPTTSTEPGLKQRVTG